jgi:hypothetical protein
MLDPKLPESLRTKLAECLSSGVFAQVSGHGRSGAPSSFSAYADLTVQN